MSERPLVVLLKSPDPDDAYEKALADGGFGTVFAPVLRFRFIEPRMHALADAAVRFETLALTSPRAVEACVRGGMVSAWRGRPVFAVGPSTAEQARAAGLAVHPDTPGTAEDLARVMVAAGVRGPVLFPCSNRRREDLPRSLRAEGIDVEEAVVYETELQRPELPAAPIEWAVFFSPSGVEAAFEDRSFPWNRLRTAAIGPTTAEALARAPAPASAVAAEPTPEALVRALATA